MSAPEARYGRWCLVVADGRVYLVPVHRRDEAVDILQQIDDYWNSSPGLYYTDGPYEPPEWMEELAAGGNKLSFTDPREDL